jgi:putative transposase
VAAKHGCTAFRKAPWPRLAGTRAYPACATAYDNAWTESFIGTLKLEMLQDGCFENADDAQTKIFDYIEGYNNTHRKHSPLGYKTPNQFEAKIQSIN